MNYTYVYIFIYFLQESASKLQWNMPQNDKNYETIALDENTMTLRNFVIGPIIAKGCSAVVYAARLADVNTDRDESDDSQNENNDSINIDFKTKDMSAFPLALKMMFNYDAESNAAAILRAMYKETVPARKHGSNEFASWDRKLAEMKMTLPPHPNVVAMYYVFADRIPALPDSLGIYPDALPVRINPEGSGRNMSLFLVMKRFLRDIILLYRSRNIIYKNPTLIRHVVLGMTSR